MISNWPRHSLTFVWFQNAVTHKKIAGDGPDNVSFSWTAPKQLSEKVTFYYTVALNGGVFWVAQKSEQLSVSA